MSPFPWSDLAILAALILLNGVFSMSELAIVSARPARLRLAAERGSGGAKVALALAAEPGKFLSTVQIGITLVGILAGVFSGATLADRLAVFLRAQGVAPTLADTLARTVVAPSQLPVGAVMAMAGVPAFIWLIVRRPELR